MDTRVKFSEVVIGEIFFDEVSGEYWRKENEDYGEIMSGVGGLDKNDRLDQFHSDEYVIVEVE